jgi:hypothetical protein
MHEAAVEVLIRHTQLATDYLFYAHRDRLREFYQSIINERKALPPATMPGLSPLSVYGITAIFFRIPDRFPLQDIGEFLRKDMPPQDPPVTFEEIEAALERFAVAVDDQKRTKYPQLSGLL